mgnify:CR=1 FL=1
MISTSAARWCLAGMLGALPFAVSAGPDDPGGIRFQFGARLAVETQSNAALVPTAAQSDRSAKLGLSFGLQSETRSQKLIFATSVSLAEGRGPAVTTGLTDPEIRLTYERRVADAKLSFAALLRETRIQSAEQLRDNVIVSGTARQRDRQIEIAAEAGLTRRVGYGGLARFESTSFTDGSAITLGGASASDITAYRLQGFVRLDLTKTAQWINSLGYTGIDQEGNETRNIWTVASRMELATPRGMNFGAVGYADTDSGTRIWGEIGSEQALPNGAVTAQLGAIRGVTGKLHLTGALEIARTTGDASFRMQFSQNLSDSRQSDAERLTSAFAMRYRTRLHDGGGLGLSVDWVRAGDTQTDLASTAQSVALSYQRAVTRDVMLDVGLRHRRLRDSVAGRARSNDIFISIGRVFQSRF